MTHGPEWHIIGQSVRGASHIRARLPNQDAIAYRPASGVGPPLMLAVSDGHGSSKSFRSNLGSAFAVEQAVALMDELVDMLGKNPKSLSAVKRTAEERLPQELVRRWQKAVDTHLHEEPFTEDELARLAQDRGESARSEVCRHPRLAYGATLLATLVAESFMLFLQLGDGDILLVSDTGDVTYALTRDPRLMANETTSLCADDAWREIRLRFHARYGEPPALIVVSTDGYANSFINQAAFLKVGSDLLDILRTDGVASVEENLLSWLEEASTAGSGDDITLGIVYRGDIAAQTVAAEAAAPAAEEVPVAEPETGEHAGTSAVPQTPEPKAQGAQSRNIVARIKHEGPHEPAKQSPLADLLGEAPDRTPLDEDGQDDEDQTGHKPRKALTQEEE